MERLDSKYFESTIAALKKAKAAENFELKPDFKMNLRAELINRGSGLSLTEEESGIWDFVLRFKYVLGAVPMFAVLVIVMANVTNWQVKIPVKDVSPEQLEKLNTSEPIHKQTENNTSNPERPAIVTFSAASVMPPDDVLAKMWEQPQANQSDAFVSNTQPAQELRFMEGDSANLKITAPNINVSGSQMVKESLQSGQTVEVTVPTNSFEMSQAPDTVVLENPNLEQTTPVVPLELNARVENSGEVPTQTEQQVTVSPTVLPVEDTFSTIQFEQKTVPPSSDTAEMKALNVQADLTNKMPVNQMDQGSLELKSAELDYQNEFAQVAPANAVNKMESSMMMIAPIYLKPEKIDYDGKNRVEIVKAVESSLADVNGSLSNDYYVKVVELENSKYKVVLFEYGRVKKVVVLAYRDGKLITVTELNY
ncbi:hypothetical protein IT411_02415 [Candidatus Peregrinibacteria bacterium]|nr:hypothetical protein [Candidatus Peregrinibacteria bacterium]